MKGTPGYKIRTIVCISCGKTATGHFRPNQRYCSQECYRTSPKPERKTGEVRPCKICGKEVYIPNNRLKNGPKDFFCGKEHADEWAGRNKTKHTCKICGKEFRWSPSRHKAYTITYCSLLCRDADPERERMLIVMNAKQQRMTPNRVERRGYGLLEELGIEYLPQYLISDKFCVDAFIPKWGMVIQFDGDYWHGNPLMYSLLDSRQKKRVKLDHSQDAYMRTCGYTVIRIWASDLEKHLDHVKTHLQTLLARSTPIPVAQR